MRLYHGTDDEIEKFDLLTCDKNRRDCSNTTGQTGIFFSDDKEVASGFCKSRKTYEVNVELEEPFIIKANGQRFGSLTMDTMIDYGFDTSTIGEYFEGNLDVECLRKIGGVSTNKLSWVIRNDIWDDYDGIIVEDVIDNGFYIDDREKKSTVVIVFNDELIKLK